MKPRVALVALAVVAFGCAPTYHRAQRYRFNHVEAAALGEKAVAWCEAAPEVVTPTRPFATDGCTLWPDGLWTGTSWQSCCVKHDAQYWCGGSSTRRRDSDKELRQCVADEQSSLMGGIMWLGTRVFGDRKLPVHWRWGFGHPYPAPDPPAGASD